jgi:hypothetical protein
MQNHFDLFQLPATFDVDQDALDAPTAKSRAACTRTVS